MSNARILKNSAILYFRLLITLGLGLFTTRIVINALGIDDYGIYGVVAGLITMFGFMNAAMSSSTQRYLSFDLGLNETTKLQQTFTTAINIHLLIGVVSFLLAQGIGLWAINHLLDIPEDRLSAANTVFQFSLVAFFFGIIQVPYHAATIAYERMNAYAYISIVDAVLKLIAAYLLMTAPFDRLVFYSQLLAFISVLSFVAYFVYVQVQFKAIKYIKYFDKKYYAEILSFSGWNLFGNIAAVARGQGVNILINIFFGVALNAAYAVAMMIQGVLTQFASSIQQAVNPQIIKTHAEKDNNRTVKLISMSSKYSFFLLLFIIIPFHLNLDYILYVWLNNVPDYSSAFIDCVFLFILIEVLSSPMIVGIQATGKVKIYQLAISIAVVMVLPVIYFLFELGYKDPLLAFYVVVFSSFISLLLRLYFIRSYMHFDVVYFIRNTILRIFYVLAVVVPAIILNSECSFLYGYSKIIFDCILFGLILAVSVYFLGMDSEERAVVKKIIGNALGKSS